MDSKTDTVLPAASTESGSKYYGPPPSQPRAAFGAATHVGLVRTNNEDHYAVVERNRTRRLLMTNVDSQLFVPTVESAYTLAVADGMGGAACGEVASRLALTTAWHWGGRETRWLMNVGEHTNADWDEQLQQLGELLHEAIRDYSRQQPATAGMGTTLTMAYVVGEHLFTIHIGDSRVYLVRNHTIHRLSSDHTLGEELATSGAPPEIARRQRHILTNVLGASGVPVTVEWRHLPLKSADQLLLCTDGLSDLVNDAELLEVVRLADAPQTACDQLVQAALARGGKDNVTVVIGKFVW